MDHRGHDSASWVRKNKKGLVIGTVAVLVLVMLAVIWWFRSGRSYGYPMEVSEFTSQAARIRKGMTEQEVLGVVAKRTGYSLSPDHKTLYLRLEGKESALIPRTTIYIKVEMDESNRVQEVSIFDGGPIRGRFW